MLSRKLELNSIASTIKKVDMARVKELIPKTSVTDAVSAKIGSATSTISNEIGDVLSDLCNTKGLDKVSKDYLTNLDRTLKLNPDMELCDAVNSLGAMDIALLKNNPLKKVHDFSGLVKNAVNKEMDNAGLLGGIPDCLLNGILGKLNKLSGFGGLSLNMRLDLLGLIKDSCAKEVMDSLTHSVLEQEATKTVLNGLMDSSPVKAMEYITTKAKSAPKVALLALEDSLNEKEGKHTLEKLSVFNRLKTTYGDEVVLKDTFSENLLANINNDDSDTAYMGDNFSSLSYYTGAITDDSLYSKLKGKTNIGIMASNSLANTVSTDDMGSTSKTTVLTLANTAVLVNAFA